MAAFDFASTSCTSPMWRSRKAHLTLITSHKKRVTRLRTLADILGHVTRLRHFVWSLAVHPHGQTIVLQINDLLSRPCSAKGNNLPGV